MPSTLAEAFAADVLAPRAVTELFGPEAVLGRSVSGVDAHAFELLGTRRPLMRHYAMLLGVFLRMPRLVWVRYRLRHVVPVVMLASSIGADCRYSSGHACMVALGRGVDAGTIADLVRDHGGVGSARPPRPAVPAGRSPVSSVPPDALRAAYRAGLALGRLPSTYTAEHRHELDRWFSDPEVEAIVLAASLMGWLNKMMDGSGVTLEADVVGHAGAILGPHGWTPRQHPVDDAAPDRRPAPIRRDRLWTIPGLAGPAGRATRRTQEWMTGVPTDPAALSTYLRRSTGHPWPVLDLLSDRAAAAATATLLVDVLGARPDRYPALVSPAVKASLWVAYASAAGGSPEVLAQARALGHAPLTAADRAAYHLGLATLRSPAEIAPSDVTAARHLGPAAALEVLETVATAQTATRLWRGLTTGRE